MLRHAILAGLRGNSIQFEFPVPNDQNGPPLVTLKSHAGPSGSGEPFITTMLPKED